jgi:hypothetical protein
MAHVLVSCFCRQQLFNNEIQYYRYHDVINVLIIAVTV